MAGVPRSQVLLRWTSNAAGNSPIWQTPAGWVTLVKSIYAYQGAGADAPLRVYIATPAQTVTVAVAKLTLVADTPQNVQCWFALNPGDIMFVGAGGAGQEIWISGAVLAGPNQFPPAGILSLNNLPALATTDVVVPDPTPGV